MTDNQSPASGEPRQDGKPKVGVGTEAALAGGGLGTLIATAAQNLSDTNDLKPWITSLAPAVAVSITAVYLWARRRIDKRNKEKATKAAIERAKATLRAAIIDKSTPAAKVEEYKAELARLDELVIRSDIIRVEELLKPGQK